MEDDDWFVPTLGDMLDQDAIWVDIEGRVHFLEDMDGAYLRNLIKYIARRLAPIAANHGMTVQEFQVWLFQYPLIQRLVELARQKPLPAVQRQERRVWVRGTQPRGFIGEEVRP